MASTTPSAVLKTVYKSTFTFRSDVPPSKREDHKSGVIHALKSTVLGRKQGEQREEHAFVWVQDVSHTNGISAVVDHLIQFGFDVKDTGMSFVPFSCRENWMHRYPHACE